MAFDIMEEHDDSEIAWVYWKKKYDSLLEKYSKIYEENQRMNEKYNNE